MDNDHDLDLTRLFDQIPEPAPDEAFVRRVTKRIVLLRYSQRVTPILLVLVGAAALILAKPWLMSATRGIALGSGLVTSYIVAVLLSPAGWAIGCALGLPFLLRTLSSRRRL